MQANAVSETIVLQGYTVNEEPPTKMQKLESSSPLLSLPQEILLRILARVPDVKSYRMSDDCKSGLIQFAISSSQAHAVALIAKREWVSREQISLKTFGCTTAEEAIQYIINHNLKSANLLHFPDITQEQLQRLCDSCPRLEYMWVRSRSIQTLAGLPRMAYLHTLDCSQCAITEFPENFAEQFPNLQRLRCYANHALAALPTNLPQLIELDCRYTQISTIPDTLTGLTHVSTTNCPIRHFPVSIAPTLTYLSCAQCPIERLPESLPQLRSLDCHSCAELTALPSSLPLLSNLRDSGSGIRERPYMPKIACLNDKWRSHDTSIEEFIAFH